MFNFMYSSIRRVYWMYKNGYNRVSVIRINSYSRGNVLCGANDLITIFVAPEYFSYIPREICGLMSGFLAFELGPASKLWAYRFRSFGSLHPEPPMGSSQQEEVRPIHGVPGHPRAARCPRLVSSQGSYAPLRTRMSHRCARRWHVGHAFPMWRHLIPCFQLSLQFRRMTRPLWRLVRRSLCVPRGCLVGKIFGEMLL
jgi:hypothetical protein